MGTVCEKGGLHVVGADARACDAMPDGSACDAMQRADVPAAEPELDVVVVHEEPAGALTTPTPTKDVGLTETEKKVVEVVADVAAAVGAKESGVNNSTA